MKGIELELTYDHIDALEAEHRLRREIRLTTGKTPEMLRQYAKYVPLKDHEQLLLEAWQDAKEYAGIAEDRMETLCNTPKGGENDGQEPEQQEPEQQAPEP